MSTRKECPIDITQIQSFFFKAMQMGYAVEKITKTKVLDMPQHKEIRYEDGDFLLVDRWCVNPDSNKSIGTTTIWQEEKPVWFMSYGGVYPKRLIPTLKRALSRTYLKAIFRGGRGEGMDDFEAGVFYINRVENNNFSQFNGREEVIFRLPGTYIVGSRGYHDYWGMSLL